MSMEAAGLYGVEEVAGRTGLSVAQVRYFASLYGESLGAFHAARDEWIFRGEHLAFFRALAQGWPPVAALRAVNGPPADTPPGDPFPEPPPVPVPEGVPGDARQTDTAGHRPSTAVPESAAAVHQTATDDPAPSPPPPGVGERLEELTWQIQDLLEETKQVQILLSRIIALLQKQQTGSPAKGAGPVPPPARNGSQELPTGPVPAGPDLGSEPVDPRTHYGPFGASTHGGHHSSDSASRGIGRGTQRGGNGHEDANSGHDGTGGGHYGGGSGHLGAAGDPGVIRAATLHRQQESVRLWEPGTL